MRTNVVLLHCREHLQLVVSFVSTLLFRALEILCCSLVFHGAARPSSEGFRPCLQHPLSPFFFLPFGWMNFYPNVSLSIIFVGSSFHCLTFTRSTPLNVTAGAPFAHFFTDISSMVCAGCGRCVKMFGGLWLHNPFLV